MQCSYPALPKISQPSAYLPRNRTPCKIPRVAFPDRRPNLQTTRSLMARYFIHISNGDTFEEDVDRRFSDLEDAKAHAVACTGCQSLVQFPSTSMAVELRPLRTEACEGREPPLPWRACHPRCAATPPRVDRDRVPSRCHRDRAGRALH